MKVLINPTKTETGSGLTAELTWQNPDVQAAFEKLFGVNPKTERLMQIEIDSEGITARLEYTNMKGTDKK